jgi:tetratricopeptide (TPR) repeat protein
LKVALEGGKTSNAEQTNPEAYNAYLQGRYFADRRDKESYEKGIGYFQQALQIDPNYARAWTGLSLVHIRQAEAGYVPVDEGYGKARKEAEKALQLDQNLAEGYSCIGWIKKTYDWDWTGADAAYKKAMELEPTNADVVRGAASLAATLGRLDEAIALDRRAIALDPLSNYHNLGVHTYYAGRYQEAEKAFRRSLEMHPELSSTHSALGRVYLAQSQLNEAFDEMQKEPDPFSRIYGLALVYHAAGKKQEADAALSEAIEKYQSQRAFYIAEIYAYRGETDKAFEWLERAYKQHDTTLSYMKVRPLFAGLRHDPRWPVFLKKMKLPLD